LRRSIRIGESAGNDAIRAGRTQGWRGGGPDREAHPNKRCKPRICPNGQLSANHVAPPLKLARRSSTPADAPEVVQRTCPAMFGIAHSIRRLLKEKAAATIIFLPLDGAADALAEGGYLCFG